MEEQLLGFFGRSRHFQIKETNQPQVIFIFKDEIADVVGDKHLVHKIAKPCRM